jgi:hypothetical protein
VIEDEESGYCLKEKTEEVTPTNTRRPRKGHFINETWTRKKIQKVPKIH